jgi:7-cyano-7-deazaguanine synthase
MKRSALVLFSGGQDSATCVAWALTQYDTVETIGFNYGQRHSVELECRKEYLLAIRDLFPDWSSKLGADHVIDLSLIPQIGDSAMTTEIAIEMNANGLPNTFVPGRNLLFFVAAAALAYRRGLAVLVGGMCETDYSGYPDCRDDTLKALQVAINLGLDSRLLVETPLMWITKAQTWEMAEELGGKQLVGLVREKTHTCYVGDRANLHPWGYGCGVCPACELRSKGYGIYSAGSAR